MNTTAQVKQSVKNPLQTFADEPLEMLKAAKRQISGYEPAPYSDAQQEQAFMSKAQEEEQKVKKEQSANRDNRALEALESELRDIRRQKLFNELMQKITAGEDVPIEEFQELSHEQRDVLKAQREAAILRANTQKANSATTLAEPPAKKGRRLFGFGQKSAAEKQQTRVEKPLPPSG